MNKRKKKIKLSELEYTIELSDTYATRIKFRGVEVGVTIDAEEIDDAKRLSSHVASLFDSWDEIVSKIRPQLKKKLGSEFSRFDSSKFLPEFLLLTAGEDDEDDDPEEDEFQFGVSLYDCDIHTTDMGLMLLIGAALGKKEYVTEITGLD